MIKKLLVLIFFFIPLSSNSQNDSDNIMSISYDWDQLNVYDKNEILKSSEYYLDELVKNNINDFWESCHSKFKLNTPYESFKEVGLMIADMINNFDSIEFIDAKKVTFLDPPKSSKFVTGGSLDKANPTYLHYYALAGIKNQSLSIYRYLNGSSAKMVTMKFGWEDNSYKLTNLEINTCTFNGKNANYFNKLAEKWSNKLSKIPELFALHMTYKLSFLGNGTETNSMIEIREKVQKLQKDESILSEFRQWKIGDSTYTIINFDFIEVERSFYPIISYVSKVELGEENIDNEAMILFKYLLDKYPDLVNEFKKFIFTAYEEYPALRTKQYRNYRTYIDIVDIK